MTDEYQATLDYLRHLQGQIADSVPGYFAIAAPLAGVALGAGEFPAHVRFAACLVGFIMSVVWYSMNERLRVYVNDYWIRLEAMEGDTPGLIAKDAALRRRDPFLRNTPSTQILRTASYLFGIVAFTAMAVQLLGAT